MLEFISSFFFTKNKCIDYINLLAPPSAHAFDATGSSSLLLSLLFFEAAANPSLDASARALFALGCRALALAFVSVFVFVTSWTFDARLAAFAAPSSLSARDGKASNLPPLLFDAAAAASSARTRQYSAFKGTGLLEVERGEVIIIIDDAQYTRPIKKTNSKYFVRKALLPCEERGGAYSLVDNMLAQSSLRSSSISSEHSGREQGELDVVHNNFTVCFFVWTQAHLHRSPPRRCRCQHRSHSVKSSSLSACVV